MALLGTQALTLSDLQKRVDPDGNIAYIIEALLNANPIMDDIVWKEGNLPTGNRTTVRASMPTPSIRRINAGVARHKSSTRQVQDTCIILEDRSCIDIEELALARNREAFRRSEDAAFVGGFTDAVAANIFYGNTDDTLDTFNGLTARYDTIGGEKNEAGYQVVAGGTAMYNCEPIADFIDLAFIGEGEEMDVELIELHRQARREGWSKHDFLVRAAQIRGIYVPSLYDVDYNDDGTVKSITAKEGAPKTVLKRIVENMDEAYYPTKTIVPSTEIVQDRVSLELFRGCIRGCRFCQAGYVYRPVRNRSEKLLRDYAIEAVEDSGYQDMTLSSLSTSDYPHLVELCDDLEDFCAQRHVTLALPSLRADNFSMALMERLQKGRKTGLTFAPEAGTQRLRDAINKNLTEEDLLESCRRAFAGGYSAVKLYFMLGLPTETDEDVLGIAKIADDVWQVWRDSTPNRSRGVRITVSTSWFVPKPHTAFQWEPQIPIEEYERRVKLLRGAIRSKAIHYNWHPSPTSFMEAVISCGDRRLGRVIETAWRKGETLSAWEDYFQLERWMEAFEECGLDPHFYANRRRSEDEILPWSMISTGVSPAYFKREHALTFEGVTTPDCRTHCNACGANCLVGGKCDV